MQSWVCSTYETTNKGASYIKPIRTSSRIDIRFYTLRNLSLFVVFPKIYSMGEIQELKFERHVIVEYYHEVGCNKYIVSLCSQDCNCRVIFSFI